MKLYSVRKLNHPLFRNRPVYIDTGDGCFGTFQVKAQAERVIAIIKKNPQLER